MIPSLFSRNHGHANADRSPVFTEDDIRKLVQSFPPPEPRPGKQCLVRSLSSRNLVHSDAVARRFKTLLQTAPGLVFLNSLPNELGVYDVQWLLTQEDDNIFFTRDRLKILPESICKHVFQQLKSLLARGGVDLDRFAEDNHVTPATLRRIVAAQDTTFILKDLENGQTYDVGLLEKIKRDLLEALEVADSSVILSNDIRFSQVPLGWLESTCQELVSADSNDVHGIVETGLFAVRFTPHSTLVQRESELKQAQDAYIREVINRLTKDGYCDVTLNSRPESLRDSGDIDLVQTVRDAFEGKGSGEAIVQLTTKHQKPENAAKAFLIRLETLSTMLSSLVSRAAEVAEEQWAARGIGEEITFDTKASGKLASTESRNPDLDLAILEGGDSEGQIERSFRTKLTQLQESTAQQFATTTQTELLSPLRLYTDGAETIKDSTTQPRVTEFIRDWARRELVPEFIRSVKGQKLLTTKSAARDLDKFTDASQTAKTLDDVLTAATKLVRKQKVEQPDNTAVETCRRAILKQKVEAMKRMKRASDLLQNVTWILLASRRGGLFMSSGKDTSRMIKLVKEDDAETGARLEGWRDAVKEGKDSEVQRREMRELAAEVLDQTSGANLMMDGDAKMRGEEGTDAEVKTAVID